MGPLVCAISLFWAALAHAENARSADQPSFIHSSGAVPPGFEDLVAVQTTQADVFFGDTYLLSTFIEYDLESVTILSPSDVTDAIATLLDPASVAAALTGALPSNADRLCHLRNSSDCGTVQPAVAAVLFDASRFRLDLFVHPDQLAVVQPDVQRYLPQAQQGVSLLHELSFAAAGRGGNNGYALHSESYLARGAARLRARYGLQDSGFSLDELSLAWDERDRELEVGAFRSSPSGSAFLNDSEMLGVRIASSTNTRTDLVQSGANQILLFLDRRSRVDVYRGDELLDSRFYDAGNQQLDTSRLPDGAYDLTLRIVDLDGQERLESHFYVRSDLLPPRDQPRYLLEIGAFTQPGESAIPELTGGGWLRVGRTQRITDALALDAELLFSDSGTLLALGAYVLGQGWFANTGVLFGAEGERGVALRAGWQRSRWLFNVDIRKVLADDSATLTAAEFASREQLLGGNYTQASFSLGFPLFKGQAYLRGRYNDRDRASAERALGFSYVGPLLRGRQVLADLNVDGNLSSRRSWVRVGVNLRWRGEEQQTSVQPQLQWLDEDDQVHTYNALLDARWTRSLRSSRYGDVQQGLFAFRDVDRAAFGGTLASQSNRGYGDLTLAHEQGNGGSGLAYSANGRFSLVTRQGRTSLGGGNGELAAVVVDIDGDLPGTEFNVMVDNRTAGYATTRRRSVIALAPYATYDISIAPVGDALLSYDETVYPITLYPGNVARLSFGAARVTVLIGQALTEDGQPLRHARFENVEGYATTDAYGWYQVEVDHGMALRLVDADNRRCLLRRPNIRAEDGLLMLDPLVCMPQP